MCLFEDFNLSIKKGQFVSVVGSNGSGKTSMLTSYAEASPRTAGRYSLKGRILPKKKNTVACAESDGVYQNPAMGTCPNMTILENMSMADHKGKFFGLSMGTNKSRIPFYQEQLRQLNLGLEDKLHVKVGSLSGGQRQAMSLLMSTMPPIDFLILDEHTAALDPKTAELIMVLTDKVVREKQLTTIMVTHNLRYAVEYGDRLLMMHQGHAVMDLEGDEKKNMNVDTILEKFNEISIECGN